MSERSNAQRMIWEASDACHQASESLDEARAYIEGYDFLSAANPGVLGELGMAIQSLSMLRDHLWDMDLKSVVKS